MSVQNPFAIKLPKPEIIETHSGHQGSDLHYYGRETKIQMPNGEFFTILSNSFGDYKVYARSPGQHRYLAFKGFEDDFFSRFPELRQFKKTFEK